ASLYRRFGGQCGLRPAATSAETAIDFFQSSASVLHQVPAAMRAPVLRLASKQAALSANTAVECFKSSSDTILGIGDPNTAGEVLTICLELARHSVKHSYDLLRSAPAVIGELRLASKPGEALGSSGAAPFGNTPVGGSESVGSGQHLDSDPASGSKAGWLVERAVALTSAFAYKSGGTAAEFFAELP